MNKALVFQRICHDRQPVRIWTSGLQTVENSIKSGGKSGIRTLHIQRRIFVFSKECVFKLLWCLIVQSGMWAFLIVEKNVLVDLLSQFSLGSVRTAVKFLLLEHREEGFHNIIVVWRSGIGKWLHDFQFLKQLPHCVGSIGCPGLCETSNFLPAFGRRRPS